MKIVLKKQFINSKIYVSFLNNNIIGKFIPEGLYKHLYKNHPNLFELVCEDCLEKNCICNDIFINDTE
jgi:hypothetical protein